MKHTRQKNKKLGQQRSKWNQEFCSLESFMQLNWSPTSIDQGQLEGARTPLGQGSFFPVSEPDWEKTTVGKRVTELVS